MIPFSLPDRHGVKVFVSWCLGGLVAAVSDSASGQDYESEAAAPAITDYGSETAAEPDPDEAGRPEPIVTYEGEVFDLEDAPVEGAAVMVEGGGLEEPVVAVADPLGWFYFTDLPPGRYRVTVSAPAFRTFETEEVVVEGHVTVTTYRLERSGVEFETVVRAQRPPREMTRRTLETREIALIPGTMGDSLQSIQNLPGVARPVFDSAGLVVVRGSAPGDTAFYMDGVRIPLIYHFGTFRSAIAADLLERIDFYPGNFGVRYGGVMGGIIDVEPRVPERERWTGYVDANIIDAGALVGGPLAAGASIAGSVRRSYIDAILPAVVPDDAGVSIVAAPVYWDYQLIADWEPSRADRLRFFVYGSDDALELLFAEPEHADPAQSGNLSTHIGFHRGEIRWVHEFSAEADNALTFGFGYNELQFAEGDLFDMTFRFFPLQLRDELSFRLTDRARLTFGVDSGAQWYLAKARYPDVWRSGENTPGAMGFADILEVDSEGFGVDPGAYVEAELRPFPALRVIPGVRMDLHNDASVLVLDPRLNIRWEIVGGTILKFGLGLYTQPPQMQEWSPSTGNPFLDVERAVHYGVGVEQDLWGNLDLAVDLFYKSLDRLVRASSDEVVRDGELVAERYDNDAYGRVYGLEALLRYEPDERFFGWIALTVLRSEIHDPQDGWFPADYDQTINLTMVGSFVLGGGWTAGLRFRLSSGAVKTPVVASIYDADADMYVPVMGSRNSIRLPLFHQLDLRVDKTFDWDVFKLSIYLDVYNIYWSESAEEIAYNYDYSENTYVYGLPIIPALGIKAEF